MEARGRLHLGLVLLRSRAEFAVLCDGNPGTWNPDQRKGDNKWSMTIFARDPDTGMAKWGYQMTPWDAWDYDGVNENVLTDLNMDGKTCQSLGPL
jgi:glucose dehydrogenase